MHANTTRLGNVGCRANANEFEAAHNVVMQFILTWDKAKQVPNSVKSWPLIGVKLLDGHLQHHCQMPPMILNLQATKQELKASNVPKKLRSTKVTCMIEKRPEVITKLEAIVEAYPAMEARPGFPIRNRVKLCNRPSSSASTRSNPNPKPTKPMHLFSPAGQKCKGHGLNDFLIPNRENRFCLQV